MATGRDRRQVAGALGCGCALAAAAVYVAINDPSSPGVHLPACPLYATTGLWCPGCGMTRATHALLRGDIAAAFGFNLFFPLFVGGIVIAWLAWLRRSLGCSPIFAFSRLPTWLPVAAGTGLIAFGVLRNVPGFQALGP